MKTIIVGFSHSTKTFSPFSKAIQLWDKTNYSHVYFEFESIKYDVDMVYQASSTMLNYMSKDVFLLNNKVIKEFKLELTDEQYFNLMQSCMKSAGLKYGQLEIVGIVIAEILRLDYNPFADSERYICSEWVGEQLEALGYSFIKDLALLKPSDIYMELENENES